MCKSVGECESAIDMRMRVRMLNIYLRSHFVGREKREEYKRDEYTHQENERRTQIETFSLRRDILQFVYKMKYIDILRLRYTTQGVPILRMCMIYTCKIRHIIIMRNLEYTHIYIYIWK